MEKLSQLLHDLVDGATQQGNSRGELHALADDALAELDSVIAQRVAAALGAAEKVAAAPAPAIQVPPFVAPRSSVPAKP